MTLMATLLFSILIGSIAIQSLMVLGFVGALRRWKRTLPPDAKCPKVAVILCLRGADPFLESCIKALLRQDYPCYEVRVIVDSPEDPAWQELERVIASCGAKNLYVESLTQRRNTCSLKCSSLTQAVSSLDDSYEVVALVDADSVPHRTWLRELVAPLNDPRVGAATGNRWYMPSTISWASLVRYLWNAAAVVQMYSYGIPWGGTLAIRRDVIRQSNLLERWGLAFCEDTMVYRALREQGLRLAFVPSLMMVNRETCEMSGFYNWLQRQLLTARLYHPGWPAVVLHGISTPLLLAISSGLLLTCLVTGRMEAAAWVGGGLVGYCGLLPCLLLLMEVFVRRIIVTRGEPTDWLSALDALKALPAIVLTQIVYPAGLVSTILLRNVEWRGVRYNVEGPWQIRLIEYQPHAVSCSSEDALLSL